MKRPVMTRRALLALPWLVPFASGALPLKPLVFPRDFGSHPELRTEWWYITGHARSGAREFGFQLTFFRSRVDEAQSLSSAFAARQLIFAHAAITDLAGKRLLHDQRIARAGFGVASASEEDTDVKLRDWQLRREGRGYVARLPAEGFGLDLRFTPTQPVLLQGKAGLSQKGPDPAQASYYYSEPQLEARGTLKVGNQGFEIDAGRAWLDHEWSEALLHPEAVGWDWMGINLADGGALTAFRLRRKDGSALWHGGSFRNAAGELRSFGNDELRFEPLHAWTSPRTRAVYPTQWRVHTPAGAFELRALLDDQELDSAGSTGTVYWEGVSDLFDASGRAVGRGYLELTGYVQALRM